MAAGVQLETMRFARHLTCTVQFGITRFIVQYSVRGTPLITYTQATAVAAEEGLSGSSGFCYCPFTFCFRQLNKKSAPRTSFCVPALAQEPPCAIGTAKARENTAEDRQEQIV
jgi:hypothetical protein